MKSKRKRTQAPEAPEARTFAALPVGACFKFADGPHELGWPDGPWRKTGADTVEHLEGIGTGTVEDLSRPTARWWTEESVRAELPTVQVRNYGTVYPGRIAGRKHPFATVLFGNNYSAEWAWDTIANCLNAGRPLQA